MNSYVLTFLVSLGSAIIATLILFLAKKLEDDDRCSFLQKVLFVIAVPFGIIALYAATAGVLLYFIVKTLLEHVSATLRDHRIKCCKAYAMHLISNIESKHLASAAKYLLDELHKKIYANPKVYKKPYEVNVQKTLCEIASFKIDHCRTTAEQSTALYMQLKIIQEKLLLMLRANGFEI